MNKVDEIIKEHQQCFVDYAKHVVQQNMRNEPYLQFWCSKYSEKLIKDLKHD